MGKISLRIGRIMNSLGNAYKFTGVGTIFWLIEKGGFESISNEFLLRSWGKKGGYPLYAPTPNSISFIFPGTKRYLDKQENPVSIPADVQTIESPAGLGVHFNSHGLEGEVNYQFRFKIKNDKDAFKYQIELDGNPEGLREPVRSKLIELMSRLDSTGDITKVINGAEDLTEESEKMIKDAMGKVNERTSYMQRAIDPDSPVEDEFIKYLKDKYGVSSVALDVSGIDYDQESRGIISLVLEEKREADARIIRANSQAQEAEVQAESTLQRAEKYIDAGKKYYDAGSGYGAGDIALELQGRDNIESIAGRKNIRTIVTQSGLPQKFLPFPDENDSAPTTPTDSPQPSSSEPETPSSENINSQNLEDKTQEPKDKLKTVLEEFVKE